MNRTRFAASCAIVLLTALNALAAPVEVILQFNPSPFDPPSAVTMTAYGDLGVEEFQEQFPGSLQSTLSGNLRVRFDPANLNSIEFLFGSHLDLSSGSLPALPGFGPANFAGVTPGGLEFAIRGASLWLESPPLTMTPSGVNSHRFASDHIHADFRQGHYVSTFAGGHSLPAEGSLIGNSYGIDGLLTWYPTAPGDNLFLTLPIQYRYVPSLAGGTENINIVSQLRMFARFSMDNVAEVGAEGGTVEVLGGASTPGGVSATISDVTEPGSFTAQQISLEGLPAGALEQALTVPDLAYSLSIAGHTNPTWDLGYTGAAGAFEVALGYAEYTNPSMSEDRLVLYHYNHLGTWERVPGQILDTEANTVKFFPPNFSPFMLAVSVPEPSSGVLAAVGLVGLVVWGGRRRQGQRVTSSITAG